MLKRNKFLIIFLALLITFTGVAVAADVDNSTDFSADSTSTVVSDSTPAVDTQVTSSVNEDNNLVKETKNVKRDENDPVIVTSNNGQDNFDDLFDVISPSGATITVHQIKNTYSGKTIKINTDITRNDESYIVNVPITLTSDYNNTIDLNTSNGYNSSIINHWTSINFTSGASGSTISNMQFHNTQIFVKGANDIEFNQITVKADQPFGKGTGLFAIRESSTEIDVTYSYFDIDDNDGISVIALTNAEDCIIDHNNIVASGKVGNLIYLNTYFYNTNPAPTVTNRHNTISYNTLTGPTTPVNTCFAIAIAGPDNTIEHNNIYYAGTGITTNWQGSYDVEIIELDENDFVTTYEGNKYYNNNLYDGATFLCGNYSIVEGNVISGAATISGNSNVTNNIFQSTVTIKNNVNFKNNNVENSTVYVNGADCDLCGNNINTLLISAYPIHVCYDNIFTNYPTDPNIDWYAHGSRSNNLNKNYLRSVKTSSVTDGIEYNEVDIDDEETFLKYFRYQQNGGLYLPIATYVTGNTRYKLGYFPENGKMIYFMSNMLGQYMKNHFSIVGKEGFTLNNVGFYIIGLRVSISNLNLNYNLEDEQNPITPIHCQSFGMASETDAYVEFDHLNITLKSKYQASTLLFNLNRASVNDNDIIQNSIINVEVPAGSYNIINNRASNVKILNNTINVKETYAVENPSIIAINGLYNPDNNYMSTNVTCIGNTITMNGKSSLTGIQLGGNTNNITNNTIIVYSSESTATGVELTGNDNTVTDNKILANDKTGNDAVTATGENNVVENNTVAEFDTRIPTNIELNYDATSIDVGQRLVIRGVFTAEGQDASAECIKIYDNEEELTSINTDEDGTITYAYTPTVAGDHNITFKFEGNETHQETETTISITANEHIKEYTIQVDTTEFTAGTTATISASIYADDEKATDISKGKVTFKVNGKTLKDTNGKVIYAKVTDGVATIENYEVPADWAKNGTTIQAVYSGSSDVAKMSSEKTEITVTPKELILTTSDVQATAGSKITLTATLNDNTINTRKIVFKINGKTVKDENGKVIYAKVVNGTVNVQYTLPSDMKAKEYNLTATYISSDYERLEDTKTLTIN